VPTSHVRIPVTKDPALTDALDRTAALVAPGIPTATLVHDLAIRGAHALLAAHQQDTDAIERLIRRTTSDDACYDRDVLADIDRRGWGQP
jgi:hypothetical protein